MEWKQKIKILVSFHKKSLAFFYSSWYNKVRSLDIIRCTTYGLQSWRNWHTRQTKDLVRVSGQGFKSPRLHYMKRIKLSGLVLFCVQRSNAKPETLVDFRKTVSNSRVTFADDEKAFPEGKVKENKADFDLMKQQCRWLKHCEEDSKTLSEDEWFNVLRLIVLQKHQKKQPLKCLKTILSMTERKP